MKIVDDYLEVTEPEIAVLFLGERAESDGEVGVICSIHRDGWQLEVEPFNHGAAYEAVYDSFQYPIPIPKETVKKVCEYRIDFDNCAWLGWGKVHEDFNSPIYGLPNVTICAKLKANALTIGKTVGELRELWEWMEK